MALAEVHRNGGIGMFLRTRTTSVPQTPPRSLCQVHELDVAVVEVREQADVLCTQQTSCNLLIRIPRCTSWTRRWRRCGRRRSCCSCGCAWRAPSAMHCAPRTAGLPRLLRRPSRLPLALRRRPSLPR